MEMLDGSWLLNREWETIGMEGDGCCCGAGHTGSHGTDTLIQTLRQRETRLRRMARFLAVAFVLLVAGALVLLITVVQGRRGHPDSQPTVPPISHTSGVSVEQQQHKDSQYPSAMLTAPKGEIPDGEYLEWENKDGHAYCHGGFNYSSGNLVVPMNGIYRVFLQITYESKEDYECPDVLRLATVVLLFRETYAENVPLLSSVDTVSCSMEPWSKSLYTAGLFSLEANCRLRVTSSNPGLIVQKEYQVFFGAELLPQSSGQPLRVTQV